MPILRTQKHPCVIQVLSPLHWFGSNRGSLGLRYFWDVYISLPGREDAMQEKLSEALSRASRCLVATRCGAVVFGPSMCPNKTTRKPWCFYVFLHFLGIYTRTSKFKLGFWAPNLCFGMRMIKLLTCVKTKPSKHGLFFLGKICTLSILTPQKCLF